MIKVPSGNKTVFSLDGMLWYTSEPLNILTPEYSEPLKTLWDHQGVYL